MLKTRLFIRTLNIINPKCYVLLSQIIHMKMQKIYIKRASNFYGQT